MSAALVTSLEVAGAVATVLAVGGALIRWGWRIGRNIARLVDAIIGEPARPGFEARPGVLERMSNVESAVGSHGDQITHVAAQTAENSRRVDVIEGLVHEIKGAVMAPSPPTPKGPTPA